LKEQKNKSKINWRQNNMRRERVELEIERMIEVANEDNSVNKIIIRDMIKQFLVNLAILKPTLKMIEEELCGYGYKFNYGSYIIDNREFIIEDIVVNDIIYGQVLETIDSLNQKIIDTDDWLEAVFNYEKKLTKTLEV